MESSTHTPQRWRALGLLSLLGLGTSLYQTLHFYQIRGGSAGLKSFCSFGKFNCEVIEMSKYADFINGVPLSSFAAGWYFAILILLWVGKDRFWRRETLRAVFLMTSFSLLMSFVYLFIMIAKIGSLCLLCLGIDTINMTMFGIVLSLKPDCPKEHPPQMDKWKRFAWAVPVCVLSVALAAMLLKPEDPLGGTRKTEVIEMILTTPQVPVTVGADEITIGPDDAPIQLVKYSDFECPGCRMGAFAVHPLMQKYKGKIRFIYRNYPLDMACNPKIERPMHKYSCEAAKIAICAHEQGQFEHIYGEFFERQEEVHTGHAKEIALEAGLDSAKLDTCLASEGTAAKLRASLDSGTVMGVESTPTFIINGRKVLGAYTTPVWDEVMRALLEKK
jgi:protein-disulfide isomerase/uncharacterized membrane protein